MWRIEVIARALCRFEGRNEDHEVYGEPAWRRYESQARVIALALIKARYIELVDLGG